MPGPNVVINIRGDGKVAEQALADVRARLAQLRSSAQSDGSLIAGAMGMIEHAIANIAIYGGILKAYEVMKQLTASSVALGVEIGNLSKQTGMSTETLSVLKYASDTTGISFEALTKGTAKLSKSMLDAEESKKQAINSFARLGISQAQVQEKSGDLYGMLGLLANRFQSIPDGPNKAATAMGLFGKAGAALVPFLDMGSRGIEELRGEAESLGIVLTADGVARMEALHESSVRLKGAMEGLGLGIMAGLEPAVVAVATALQGASKSGEEWQQIGEWIGKRAIYGAAAMAALAESVKEVGAEYQSLKAHVGEFEDYMNGRNAFTKAGRDAASQQMEKDVNDAHFAALAIQRAQQEYNNTLDQLNKTLDGYDKTPKSRQLATKPDGEVKLGDQTGNKVKSDDPISRAAVGLAEEQARAAADAQKQVTQAMLAELDTQHKMLLISDTEYYQEKLRLQVVSFEAEKAGLEKQAAELQALATRQHGDKLLKRDKSGNSAEELRTQRELLQVQEKIGEVNARSQVAGSQNNAEVYAAAQAKELAGLRTAADLERERDAGVAARIALLQRENELEAQKTRNAGGGDAEVDQVRQLGQIAVLKVQIADIDKKIRDSENDNKRAVEELNDAAAKDPRLKQQAARQISQMNQQEARDLGVLVQQYDALAKSLGGDYIEKARDLHAELDKLNRPDDREDAQFTKTLIEGMESLSGKMIETAGTGRNAFHQMTMSIEKDLIQLALKLAEEKFITPMLTGALGGVGGGRTPALPQVGALPSALPRAVSAGANELSTLAQAVGIGGGSKGGAPNVILNIQNNTSSPVAAGQTSQSYDSEAKEFVIHAVLENAGSGGLLSHLFSGAAG